MIIVFLHPLDVKEGNLTRNQSEINSKLLENEKLAMDLLIKDVDIFMALMVHIAEKTPNGLKILEKYCYAEMGTEKAINDCKNLLQVSLKCTVHLSLLSFC